MAEFMTKKSDFVPTDGMSAMGKPVPLWRRDAALKHYRDMGGSKTEKAMYHINRMADRLERDQPYEAMQEGMFIVDLTGTYRLMAVLLAAEKPRVRVKSISQGATM